MSLKRINDDGNEGDDGHCKFGHVNLNWHLPKRILIYIYPSPPFLNYMQEYKNFKCSTKLKIIIIIIIKG